MHNMLAKRAVEKKQRDPGILQIKSNQFNPDT